MDYCKRIQYWSSIQYLDGSRGRGSCFQAPSLRAFEPVTASRPTLDQLTLRVARPSDAAGCLAIYAPIVTGTSISFEEQAPDEAEMRARIASVLQRLPWLVAVDAAGTVRGYAYASRHRERAAYQWSVEVSAYVDAECRGRGVGRRLYEALFEHLVELGYCRAFAGIALPNAPSVGLHEAVGFTPVGVYHRAGFKRGAWHDVGWWERGLAEPDVPSPPRLFRPASDDV